MFSKRETSITTDSSDKKSGEPHWLPAFSISLLYVFRVFHVANAEAALKAMQEAATVEADEDGYHRQQNQGRESRPGEERPVPRAGFAEKARIWVVVAAHVLFILADAGVRVSAFRK
jgi:hypothetical protein